MNSISKFRAILPMILINIIIQKSKNKISNIYSYEYLNILFLKFNFWISGKSTFTIEESFSFKNAPKIYQKSSSQVQFKTLRDMNAKNEHEPVIHLRVNYLIMCSDISRKKLEYCSNFANIIFCKFSHLKGLCKLILFYNKSFIINDYEF